MDEDAAKGVKSRVDRSIGRVAGIRRVVEEDRYCVEILDQIAAVRSAFDALGVEMLIRHLEPYVQGQVTDAERTCAKPTMRVQLVTEVRSVLSRFLK